MKMKRLLVFLTAVLMMSCATTSADRRSVADFSDIIGKQWKLVEVYVGGRNTQFSRDSLRTDFAREMFTLTFDGQTLSGTAAPNLFSAPYTLGDNQAISIMPMRSTLMASFFQPENITEPDFFAYMQNAQKWGLADGNLELYSKTENGREVRLVFGL
jgi:heat shock protein HslJ